MVPEVRPDLDLIPAYVPGKAVPGAIKLASNEIATGPLPSVAAAIADATANSNRYPDFSSQALTERLAGFLNCSPAQVTVGCGSVALCQQLVQALCEPGDEVLFGWRSFEAYPIVSRIAHAAPIQVPLLADGRLDLDGLVRAITDRTRLIFLCTPNNPTGPEVTASELRSFLDAVPSRITVAIDEAYVEYLRSADPADGVSEALTRPNVVSLRTFSKAYGLAALRVGYLVGPPELVVSISKMTVPFSVSSLAQAAAIACLDAGEELRGRTNAVVSERERVRAELLTLGYSVPHSQANFVWLQLGQQASAFDEHCRNHKVIIRSFPDSGVRVTISAPEDNDVFLAAAQAWYAR